LGRSRKKALGGLPAWNGRIVIDGTNSRRVSSTRTPPTAQGPEQPARCLWYQGDQSRRQAFQRGVPRIRFRGARVVKAFNHLDANVLSEAGRIRRASAPCFYFGRRHTDAKAEVSQDHRTDRLFFAGRTSGVLDVGGPFWPRCRSVRLARHQFLPRSEPSKDGRAKPAVRSIGPGVSGHSRPMEPATQISQRRSGPRREASGGLSALPASACARAGTQLSSNAFTWSARRLYLHGGPGAGRDSG